MPRFCFKKIYYISVATYLLVCGWLVYCVLNEGHSIVVCPSKWFYHLPCPGCGLTRATLKCFQGKMLEAFCLNPNVIFTLAFLVGYPLLLVNDLMQRRNNLELFCHWLSLFVQKKPVFILLLVFEALIWIHNYVSNI